MASLALVTESTTHAAATRTRSALQGAGHTVTLVDDANITTTDFSTYDAIVTVRASNANAATIASELRAEIDNGKPVLLALIEQGPTAGLHSTISTALDLTEDAYLHEDSSLAGNQVTVVTAAHPITDGFSVGAVTIMTGDNWQGVIETGESYVGTLLATGDNNHPTTGGKPALIAIDSGTIDLASNTVNARVVIFGSLYAGQTDYSTDGKALIAAIMEWLLEAQTATLAVRGGIELGGRVAFKVTRKLQVRGGIELGGRVAFKVTKHLAVRGGIEVGGRVVLRVKTGRPLAVRGGIEVGGRVAFKVTRKLRIRGGIEVGGRAALTNTSVQPLAIRGGIEVGGRVAFKVTKHLAVRGGVELGGRVAFSVTRRLRIRGGIVVGGRIRYMGPGTGIVVNGGRLTTAQVLALAEEGDTFNGLLPWGGINGRVGTLGILSRRVSNQTGDRPDFEFSFDPLGDVDDVPVQAGGGRVRYRPPERSDLARSVKRRRRD